VGVLQHKKIFVAPRVAGSSPSTDQVKRLVILADGEVRNIYMSNMFVYHMLYSWCRGKSVIFAYQKIQLSAAAKTTVNLRF